MNAFWELTLISCTDTSFQEFVNSPCMTEIKVIHFGGRCLYWFFIIRYFFLLIFIRNVRVSFTSMHQVMGTMLIPCLIISISLHSKLWVRTWWLYWTSCMWSMWLAWVRVLGQMWWPDLGLPTPHDASASFSSTAQEVQHQYWKHLRTRWAYILHRILNPYAFVRYSLHCPSLSNKLTMYFVKVWNWNVLIRKFLNGYFPRKQTISLRTLTSWLHVVQQQNDE